MVTEYDLSSFTKPERLLIKQSINLATEDNVRTGMTFSLLYTEAPQALVLSIIRDVTRQCYADERKGTLPQSTPVIE